MCIIQFPLHLIILKKKKERSNLEAEYFVHLIKYINICYTSVYICIKGVHKISAQLLQFMILIIIFL